MVWRRNIILMCMLSCFAILGIAHPGFAGKADVPEKIKETVAITFAGEVMRGGYKPVTTEELKKWVDEKKPMLIVDTMPYEESYKKQHIPAAVQIEFPIPEMKEIDDNKKAELIKLLGPDKNRPIVFYCGFTECTRSHNAAMWAVNLGYKNVYRNPGGIVGWVQSGYPAEKAK